MTTKTRRLKPDGSAAIWLLARDSAAAGQPQPAEENTGHRPWRRIDRSPAGREFRSHGALSDPEKRRIRTGRFLVIGRMARPPWHCRTRNRFEMIRLDGVRFDGGGWRRS